MIKEKAKDYFLNKDKNCAEAVILAANDVYGLNMSEDALKAAGVFGGGIGGAERLCGAAAGAVLAIGIKHNTGCAHQSPEMRKRSADFINEFIGLYGSDSCKVIKPLYRKDDVRCLSVVENACDILDRHINTNLI